MASTPDKRRTSASKISRYREQQARSGLVRIEVAVAKGDASLIRGVAAAINDPQRRETARALLRKHFAAAPAIDLKALLAAAPLEGIDLERERDLGREVDL